MLEMKDVRIGLYNFVVIGLMALIFIVVAKMVFNKWQVKGVTDLVNAA